MARRYCGNVSISLEYRDTYVKGLPNGWYECHLAWPGGRKMVMVGAPASLSHAVDSPKAYDDTAHAAMSFAADENPSGNFQPDYTGSGFSIRRKR
jgi:hypothetical protein